MDTVQNFTPRACTRGKAIGFVCCPLHKNCQIWRSTIFARSDAAATIYFIARVCAAFINCQRQSLEKWSIDTTELGDSGPFADADVKEG